MKYSTINYIEECSYDGDIDNDSFKSAVCEMYGGFRHTIPTEIFTPQIVDDEALYATSNNATLCNSEQDLILYASDEGTTVSDEIPSDDLLSLNGECSRVGYPLSCENDDLSYCSYCSYCSDGDLSYDNDLILDDSMEKEFIMLTTIDERSIKLRKLDTLLRKPSQSLDAPLNVNTNDTPYIYNELINTPVKHAKDIISNMRELKLSGVPTLGSTYVSENDTSFLSLGSYNNLARC